MHKETGMRVAIKIYDKMKLGQNVQVKKSVGREVKLLSQLTHTEREGNLTQFGSGHANIMLLYDTIDT